MTGLKNVDGHFYPPFHRGWGGFAEELFHYTSRYFCATEAFLRHLAQDESSVMGGYKAGDLSSEQRDLMAAVLSCGPDRETGITLVGIVAAVVREDPGVPRVWVERYRKGLDGVSKKDVPVRRSQLPDVVDVDDVSPLDPFMNIAERLQMPVAVREHHVEVPMHALAEHLVSPNSTLRTNLHNAVIQVHNAGYVLRNHPHLTHSEAHAIADEDAV
jgi:hypothetical protein